jgi:thiamine-phosphate pyrophosphorylase
LRRARCRVDLRLYVLTDREAARRSHEEQVEAAIDGGATAIQLRDKVLPDRDLIAVGDRVAALCRRAGVVFIVNDRAHLALDCGADGVHVGPDDLPVSAARQIVGPRKIVGGSAGTIEEAQRVQSDGADYLGVGSVYATTSKSDAGEAIGLDRLVEIVRAVQIPVVGIGGITPETAAAVIRAGAAGVAVIAAVVGQPDIAAASRRLRERIDAARNGC